jgi:hypothetical protein
MVARSARVEWLDADEAELVEIKPVNEHVDRANGVVTTAPAAGARSAAGAAQGADLNFTPNHKRSSRYRCAGFGRRHSADVIRLDIGKTRAGSNNAEKSAAVDGDNIRHAEPRAGRSVSRPPAAPAGTRRPMARFLRNTT